MEQPPLDPEEWTDEQWLAWLDQVDHDNPTTPGGEAPLRRDPRSTGLAAGVGGAMGALHDVFYGPKPKEADVVIEAGGEPLDPDDIELHLDPDHPEQSTATVRPWLRDG